MNLDLLSKITKSRTGEPLMDFQKKSVKKMAFRLHNLLADEPGLGKSAQAIALWEVLDLKRILVVTKASLKTGFKRHIEDWSYSATSVQLIEGRTAFISELPRVTIINYDLLTHSYILHQLMSFEWDLLVCDEAHYLKNLDAKRTAAVLSKDGLVRRTKRTLMMTGTPVLNRPIELYPILRVLAPKVMGPYRTYWQYGKRYCAGFQDGFQFNVQGASHTDELNKSLREHYMIRRLTREVQIELPRRRHQILFMDQTNDVSAALKKLDEASRTDFKYFNVGSAGGELATLRRETAEKKIGASIEVIREYVESTDKLVIFAHHHSVIDSLAKELSEFSPVVLTGASTRNQRDRAIQLFQELPEVRVFIGQIQAAGEGIDGLQNVCSNVLFVETSWVPGEIEQACKRVHRLGQKNPVLIRFLVWANSIEEHMMRVALDKVETIKEILK